MEDITEIEIVASYYSIPEAIAMIENYSGGDPFLYAKSFNKWYEAGRDGISIADVDDLSDKRHGYRASVSDHLTNRQVAAAYRAGMREWENELAKDGIDINQIPKPSKKDEKEETVYEKDEKVYNLILLIAIVATVLILLFNR